MKYLLLLALTSCAGTVTLPLDSTTTTCKTTCGMYSNNYHGPCADLDEEEDEILTVFKEKAPINFCHDLNGWQLLFVSSQNGLFEVNKQFMFGATVIDSKVILLGTLNALPHEMGHVIDRYVGVSPEVSAKHKAWRQMGFCDIISSISKLDINCDNIGEGR